MNEEELISSAKARAAEKFGIVGSQRWFCKGRIISDSMTVKRFYFKYFTYIYKFCFIVSLYLFKIRWKLGKKKNFPKAEFLMGLDVKKSFRCKIPEGFVIQVIVSPPVSHETKELWVRYGTQFCVTTSERAILIWRFGLIISTFLNHF